MSEPSQHGYAIAALTRMKLPGLSGAWNRTVTEVDGRFAQDAALQIRGQARTAIAVEETEAEFAGVLVDPAFADAGDPSRTHQDLYLRDGKLQQLSYECGIDDESVVMEFDPWLRAGSDVGLGHLIFPCRGIQKDI
jgi:hypothetical protein